MVVGDFPLKDKLTVVTGGGSGLGLAFSILAHTAGSAILIADIRLTADAENFVNAFPNVEYQHCDVTKQEDLEALPERATEAFGRTPDVWVPAAGIFEPPESSFWLSTPPHLSTNINISHPIALTRIAVHTLLSASKPGVIIHIASLIGLYPSYSTPLYCATKWAIVGFTRSLEPLDRKEGVKVVCICPPAMDTPLLPPSVVSAIPASSVLAPKVVATEMVRMVQEGRFQGGTVAQVMPGVDGVEVMPAPYEDVNALAGLAEFEIVPGKPGVTVGGVLIGERMGDKEGDGEVEGL
ncbi:NAD(P)-binding protein [Saccharata proteae CBS 121410]|uniref:NAD(P)-binding protein n=1 Tax=Saccharata proteae CBS 121410 TaxID=1314787 RepID=A0A9P4M1N4_9PEZI|nr:NAD(P)-binding protein [Saccharata proteae CBS 121410]